LSADEYISFANLQIFQKFSKNALTSQKIFSTFTHMMMYNTQNKAKGAYGAGKA